jgi:hypothetical protein
MKVNLKERALEIGLGELSEEQLNDSALRRIIIASVGKEKVDVTSGNAASFDSDTPTGTYSDDEFVASGKNVSIQYTNPEGEFTPFVLVEGTLDLDGQEFLGSSAMSPLDYSKNIPTAGTSLPIKVRRNNAGEIRSSVLTK